MDQTTKDKVVKLLSDALSKLEEGSPEALAVSEFEVGKFIREAGATHPFFVEGVEHLGTYAPFSLIALGMDLENATRLVSEVK